MNEWDVFTILTQVQILYKYVMINFQIQSIFVSKEKK